MVEALKKLDKKFLIMFGCIIMLPILMIIFLAIIQGCSNRKITYEKYESKMIEATKKYIEDKNNAPIEEGEQKIVKLNKLIEKGYIKSPVKLLDDTKCDGKVTVVRNGSSVAENNGGFLNYIVSLKCENYSTKTFNDKLKNNVVASGSGLYKVENTYIFKGNKPQNYLQYYGETFRIMSIDEDGIIKIIKENPETESKIWDNKYNIDVNAYSGISIYKESKILEYLLDYYKTSKKMTVDAKTHIVAYDSCIGKRTVGDYSINKALDCAEKLEKQVISLVSISDYALASLDVNCNSINSKSCNNYNYLKNKLIGWTTTSTSDNSYQIARISNGRVEYKDADFYDRYNIVLYIDGNEPFKGGKGTLEKPYIIK